MDRNKDVILKMIKDRMKLGKGVDGGLIGKYRSISYEHYKYELNPLADGTVDLFLTGDLYRGMDIIDYGQLVFEIISNDDKYDMLAEKYGANQFGLTEEQNKEVKELAFEFLINKINKSYE